MWKEIRVKNGNIRKVIAATASTKVDTEDDHMEGYPAVAWNNFTEEALDPNKVRKARENEMEYVEQKGVWKLISRKEARNRSSRR